MFNSESEQRPTGSVLMTTLRQLSLQTTGKLETGEATQLTNNRETGDRVKVPRIRASVTTRRTCFCVLSTCKNVGKRRASVRGEYRVEEARVSTASLRESCNRTEIVRCKHVQLTYHLRNLRCTQPLTARLGVQTTLLHFVQSCELRASDGTRSVACQESNPGPLGSESITLPLRHTTSDSAIVGSLLLFTRNATRLLKVDHFVEGGSSLGKTKDCSGTAEVSGLRQTRGSEDRKEVSPPPTNTLCQPRRIVLPLITSAYISILSSLSTCYLTGVCVNTCLPDTLSGQAVYRDVVSTPEDTVTTSCDTESRLT
ncbi:hypothetical protein Bbelb_446880 [Branchiostoma belcheri]|nr:hypothetical protein Bbelb_446880 [Branchiostoma belcheri]